MPERAPTTLLVGEGEYVTILVSGADTGGRECVFDVVTTPGFGPPPHAHDWEETFEVLEGRYVITTYGSAGRPMAVEARRNTAVTLGPGTVHRFHNPGPEPARMRITHRPAGLEDFFHAIGTPVAAPGARPPGGAKPLDVPSMLRALQAAGVRLATPEEPQP